VLSCLYLMSKLPLTTWIRFGVWLAIGLVLYFVYGFKHSKLRAQASQPSQAVDPRDPSGGQPRVPPARVVQRDRDRTDGDGE
jgi:APA family basic amino acid/polyamine antiporter